MMNRRREASFAYFPYYYFFILPERTGALRWTEADVG